MPPVTTQPASTWGSRLASTSGSRLLVAFWTAFFLASFAAALPEPLSTMLGAIGQSGLAVIWIGYPIALLHLLSGHRMRTIGVPLIVCSTMVGIAISILSFDRNGNFWNDNVAPLLGAVLFCLPFVTGAHALKNGEKAAGLAPTTNLVATALALFALPFLAPYVHERFCLAYSNLKRALR
jgi:Na+/phosphate symporter